MGQVFVSHCLTANCLSLSDHEHRPDRKHTGCGARQALPATAVRPQRSSETVCSHVFSSGEQGRMLSSLCRSGIHVGSTEGTVLGNGRV